MKKYSTSRPRHSVGRQVQVFDSVVGSVGKLLAGLFSMGATRDNKGIQRMTKEELTERWRQIEELMNLGGPARLKQAIIEADKLLDRTLAGYGVSGSLADKLRAGERHISKEGYAAAWQAHKLRNRIVHDEGEMFDFEMRRGLEQFRNALEELTRENKG